MCRFPVVSFQKQTSRKASYKERVVIFPIAPKNTNLAMLPQKKTQHGPLAPLDPTGFRIPTKGSTIAVTRRSLPFAFCSLKTASLWVFKGITGQRSSVFFPPGTYPNGPWQVEEFIAPLSRTAFCWTEPIRSDSVFRPTARWAFGSREFSEPSAGEHVDGFYVVVSV